MIFTIDMNPFAARGFCEKYGHTSKTHETISQQILRQLPPKFEVGDRVQYAVAQGWVLDSLKGTILAIVTRADGEMFATVEYDSTGPNPKATLIDVDPLVYLRKLDA